MAYINFNGNPLYLEWAPEDAFTKESDKIIPKLEENSVKSESTSQENEVIEENTTLFVKNLSFDTIETDLKHLFEVGVGAEKIHEVTIAQKKDMKNPGKMLSMGYGFVQFKKAAFANEALKTMQHKMLDNHCIELKRSNRASSENVKTSR